MFGGPFYDQETEGAVYWVSPPADIDEEDEGSYGDEASGSGDSAHSDDTITSSEARDYFQEINGRLFVNGPDIPIWFPVDETRRVKLVHQLVKQLHGANHFGPMTEILRPSGGYQPRVLDMYTRDGSWVHEMSREFPHANFVSLDVAPVVQHVPLRNVTFEVYDIQQGIMESNESFDIVRVSWINEVSKDTCRVLKEVQRVLKPGGLVCVIQPELALYDIQDLDRYSTDSTPWAWRALEAMRSSLRSQGVELDAYQIMKVWLESDPSLWGDRYSGSAPPFERITSSLEVAYAGGSDRSVRQQEIRLILAQLVTVCCTDLAPMLLMAGISSDDVQDLLKGACAELKNPFVEYALKVHHVFAYKTPDPSGLI